MSSKEILLFEKEEITMIDKFFILMELLLSNQAPSRLECVIFIGIFYSQIISGFFAEQIEVFDAKNYKSDNILNYIEKIIRLKDLFIDNYTGYKIVLFVFLSIAVIFILLSSMNIFLSSEGLYANAGL